MLSGVPGTAPFAAKNTGPLLFVSWNPSTSVQVAVLVPPKVLFATVGAVLEMFTPGVPRVKLLE